MTSHILHGDVHLSGLNPRCERCRELADSPSQLDPAMRRRLADGNILTPLDLVAARQLGVVREDA